LRKIRSNKRKRAPVAVNEERREPGVLAWIMYEPRAATADMAVLLSEL
jgi:hypothetical protein